MKDMTRWLKTKDSHLWYGKEYIEATLAQNPLSDNPDYDITIDSIDDRIMRREFGADLEAAKQIFNAIPHIVSDELLIKKFGFTED